MDEARKLSSKVDALETHLEKTAAAAGRTDLVESLRQARTNIAKSYDIEQAMNVGNADISAPIIGRIYDKNSDKITGNLKTIGAFAEGPGAKFVQEGAKVQQPGVSYMDMFSSLGLGLGGTAALGPFGGALGALPLMRGPVRSLVLSKPYQNMMGTPNYSAGILANSLSRLPQGTGLSSLMMANPQIRGLLQGEP
jgi:hypothetical protein